MDATRVRERVLAAHRETLGATHDAADEVAADPAALETAVDAAGLELAAEPVAAPPYVVVASTGPLCRGSTDDGRLVLAMRAFALRTDGPSIESDTEPVRTVERVPGGVGRTRAALNPCIRPEAARVSGRPRTAK
jgi:hypothetical protein